MARPWPFTAIDSHTKPRSAWPYSHISPAMGEQKFLNGAYSFLAGKIRTTSRDLLAVMDYAAPEFREAIVSGNDLSLLEIKSKYPHALKEIVQFIQHPEMNKDIFTI